MGLGIKELPKIKQERRENNYNSHNPVTQNPAIPEKCP
jgi:hypothetical protein